MKFTQTLSWQTYIWEKIVCLFENNRMPHAILLIGSSGLGKKYFAQLLAKYLLCHKRAYEFGIYYQPNNDAGGIYFRLNGLKFGNSVK